MHHSWNPTAWVCQWKITSWESHLDEFSKAFQSFFQLFCNQHKLEVSKGLEKFFKGIADWKILKTSKYRPPTKVLYNFEKHKSFLNFLKQTRNFLQSTSRLMEIFRKFVLVSGIFYHRSFELWVISVKLCKQRLQYIHLVNENKNLMEERICGNCVAKILLAVTRKFPNLQKD